MAFEDILTQVSDADERAQLAGIAAKYPKIRALVEIGETAEAPLMALQGVAKDPAKVADALKRLPEWYDYNARNWDEGRQMYKREIDSEAELSAARTRVLELENRGDGEMTLDEIVAGLKSRGEFAGKDDLKNLVTVDGFRSGINQTTKRFETVYAKLTPRADEYRAKYGEAIPYDKIFDYMETNKVFDPATKIYVTPTPDQAYDYVVGPQERKLEQAANTKAIEEAEQRGIDKGRQLATQSIDGRGLPVDSRGSTGGASRFYQRTMARRAERAAGGTGDGRLGSGQAAQAGIADRNKHLAGGGV